MRHTREESTRDRDTLCVCRDQVLLPDMCLRRARMGWQRVICRPTTDGRAHSAHERG